MGGSFAVESVAGLVWNTHFGDYNLDLEKVIPPLDFGIKILETEKAK